MIINYIIWFINYQLSVFKQVGEQMEFLGTINFRQIAIMLNATLIGLGGMIALISVGGVLISVR
jgi:hypothetical protein